MRGRTLLGCIAVAAAAPLAACHAASDASSDGSAPEAGEAASSACAHAFEPPRPAPTTGSAEIDFIVAVQTIGAPDGGPPVGFDLDGVCTCNPDPSSCISRAPQPPCDGVGGRDTAGNSYLDVINTYFASTKGGKLDDRVKNGTIGYLFEVQGYNGLAEDDHVTLITYRSGGLFVDSFGDTRAPSWDGNDVWSVDPASAIPNALDAGDGFTYTPLVATVNAYVTQRQLVARLDTYPLGAVVGLLDLRDFLLVATIQVGPNGYGLDGQFAGRVATREIFGLLSTFIDSTGGPGAMLCGDSQTFLTLQREVCQSADIASDKSLDSKGSPCNALTLGLAFRAFPAKLGAPVSVKYPAPGCDGAVGDCPD